MTMTLLLDPQDITGHGNYLLASSSEDSGDARQALKKSFM